jgi:hypothetical protein
VIWLLYCMNQPAMTLTRSLPNKIALPRPQRSANVPDNVVAFNDPLQRSSWSPTTADTEDDARGCLPTSRRDGFGRALGLNGGRAHSHGRDHDRRHTLHVGQNRNGALVTPRPSTGRSRGHFGTSTRWTSVVAGNAAPAPSNGEAPGRSSPAALE